MGLRRGLGSSPIADIASKRALPINASGAIFGSGLNAGRARRMAEPATEDAGKMRVVAKATGIGDCAERLACLHRCTALDKASGVLQAYRVKEMAAARTANREQFLQIA